MKKEIWKEIPGYDGDYEISNLGRLRSYKKGGRFGVGFKRESPKILAGGYDKLGYHIIILCDGKNRKTQQVHRLVAEAFIPNPENKPQVNHIDCNPSNNCASNLEWCTRSENMKHAYKNGLISKKGERHHLNKVSKKEGGISQQELAGKYGIGPDQVSRIINRKRWAHI